MPAVHGIQGPLQPAFCSPVFLSFSKFSHHSSSVMASVWILEEKVGALELLHTEKKDLNFRIGSNSNYSVTIGKLLNILVASSFQFYKMRILPLLTS